jgi:hypothetical protein
MRRNLGSIRKARQDIAQLGSGEAPPKRGFPTRIVVHFTLPEQYPNSRAAIFCLMAIAVPSMAERLI